MEHFLYALGVAPFYRDADGIFLTRRPHSSRSNTPGHRTAERESVCYTLTVPSSR